MLASVNERDEIATDDELAQLAQRGIHWDVRAMRLVSGIERSIVWLNLDSQGEFVSLINAIDMQLESGHPEPRVIRLLSDALLALAQARDVPAEKLAIADKLEALNRRVASSQHRSNSQATR